MSKPISHEHVPEWHFKRLEEFTREKMRIGEPSPHLAIMGYLTQGMEMEDKLYALGCYAATYCLPSAQVIWTLYPLQRVRQGGSEPLLQWLTDNWPGIVTRTERRCVRSPKKMHECICSLTDWIEHGFPPLTRLTDELSEANYDAVWNSVCGIKFFGRYIAIRFTEGLRRYCGIPAMLYDIRSVGGWSPKRALCYLYPEHEVELLIDDTRGNSLTEELARDVLVRIRKVLPEVNEYILAAMLCEYKAGYENYKQYPGWTIDQEPLLYDKVYEYWSDKIDKDLLWQARKALFPREVLGEIGGWNGTRWPLTKVLRDHGYVWSDLLYDYAASAADLSRPVRRVQMIGFE